MICIKYAIVVAGLPWGRRIYDQRYEIQLRLPPTRSLEILSKAAARRVMRFVVGDSLSRRTTVLRQGRCDLLRVANKVESRMACDYVQCLP